MDYKKMTKRKCKFWKIPLSWISFSYGKMQKKYSTNIQYIYIIYIIVVFIISIEYYLGDSTHSANNGQS